MDSELARLVGCRGDYTALVALTSDDYGFAFQRRIIEFFDGDEEGVHIDVEDGAGESRQLGCDGHVRIVAARKAPERRSGTAEGDCPPISGI